MTACRFLYDNYVNEDITASCDGAAGGLFFGPQKTGSGYGDIVVSGEYTGYSNRHIVIVIDGGGNIGTATYKISYDGGTSFSATGQTIVAGANALSYGLSFVPNAGSGTDFIMGDIYDIDCRAEYGVYRALDLDRNTRYRSSSLAGPNWVKFDLGYARAPKALVIYDHNFDAGPTIKIEANSVDNWAAPPVQETVTYRANRILHYIANTNAYRYWRLTVANISNPDGYIEFSIIYLGDYFQPTYNYEVGVSWRTSANVQSINHPYGSPHLRAYNVGKEYSVEIFYETSSELDTFIETLNTRVDLNKGRIWPMFFNFNSTDLTNFKLFNMSEIEADNVASAVQEYYSAKIELSEVLHARGE